MTRFICRLTNHRIIIAAARGRYHARACWCGAHEVFWLEPRDG